MSLFIQKLNIFAFVGRHVLLGYIGTLYNEESSIRKKLSVTILIKFSSLLQNPGM
jgi:hypothetical protein